MQELGGSGAWSEAVSPTGDFIQGDLQSRQARGQGGLWKVSWDA